MQNQKLKKLYNDLSNFCTDYKEIFYEETTSKVYSYINNEIDDITADITTGIGITAIKNDFKYYISTNNFEEANNFINDLKYSFELTNGEKNIIKEKNYLTKYNHNKKNVDEIKELLDKINKWARKFDERINQVKIRLLENNQLVKIINDNNLTSEQRVLTRIAIIVMAKENDVVTNASYAPGFSGDYKQIDSLNLKKEVENICKEAIDKLNTSQFDGGLMPAVIGPGFGAVIFHEACGHAMESYSITEKTSIFTDKLNTKIASDKVTIIDDGTISNLYGSSIIDDQGELTKKNLLIDKGILVNYLTDKIDAKKLNSKTTGSARRESYKYPAISRMNNTYLVPGQDSIDEMIKSIEYGIYAKNLGGGSVSPNTGEFNFIVNFGYIIKNGKIDKPIKNVSLIGNANEILQSVEMVSDNLEFGTGMCGSLSGSVPVTIGQPTIKVSSILVGGN